MNTTSTVTPISENPKQPQQRQTAKEIIAANVKSLIEQLEAGHSDALTAYLDAMSRFHSYCGRESFCSGSSFRRCQK
jgi:hypothetical protein